MYDVGIVLPCLPLLRIHLCRASPSLPSLLSAVLSTGECSAFTCCRASPYENALSQVRLLAADLALSVFALLIVAHFQVFSI